VRAKRAIGPLPSQFTCQWLRARRSYCTTITNLFRSYRYVSEGDDAGVASEDDDDEDAEEEVEEEDDAETAPRKSVARSQAQSLDTRISLLTIVRTAPKAKKRKTEPVEEVDDEEEVEAEAEDDEVDGKDLEDDEEDAGEEDADEDVSYRISYRFLAT
jgi:hypothetical protein